MTSPVRASRRHPGTRASIARGGRPIRAGGWEDAAKSLLECIRRDAYRPAGSRELLNGPDHAGHQGDGQTVDCLARRTMSGPERDDRPPSGRRSCGGDDGAISPAKRVPARGRSLMVARPVTSDRDLRFGTLRPLRRPFNGPWPTPRVPPEYRVRRRRKMPPARSTGNGRFVPRNRGEGRRHRRTVCGTSVPGCRFIAWRGVGYGAVSGG